MKVCYTAAPSRPKSLLVKRPLPSSKINRFSRLQSCRMIGTEESGQDRLRYYDSLIEAPPTEEAQKASDAKDTPPPPPADPAAEMLKRAVRLLAESKGEAWVNKASVWPMIKRLDPTFDTKDYGHASFAEVLKALDAVVEIKKGETDHLLRIR